MARSRLCRFRYAVTERDADDAGERNHHQHCGKPTEHIRDPAARDTDASAKKSAGVDDAGTLAGLLRR